MHKKGLSQNVTALFLCKFSTPGNILPAFQLKQPLDFFLSVAIKGQKIK